MQMPEPDRDVLARRSEIVAALRDTRRRRETEHGHPVPVLPPLNP